jgi:cell fate regulator YaaT (PSP1 superfamily)
MACSGCLNRGMIHDPQNASMIVSEGRSKLAVSDWLTDIPDIPESNNLVEVRFKNTRKEFYSNRHGLYLKIGDYVTVESLTGYDIGTVALTGRLVLQRLKTVFNNSENRKFLAIIRKSTGHDKKVWAQAMEKEESTLLRSRTLAKQQGLDMKISDVEYQGDGSKAIFYYIADGRIDFRELIKLFAKEFAIRIEMKQIGVRQEAGRIGGIGSCGRELCCSSWKTNFQSIGLNAAKLQELPGNIEKFAGHCGKLKCCLMYELDNYAESRESIPRELLSLQTDLGIAYHQKTDVLRRVMYYSYRENNPENLIPVPVERVKEIIGMNKRGVTNASIMTETKKENPLKYTMEPLPVRDEQKQK